MRNRKQLIQAMTVVALLGATAWAQAPVGDTTYGDSTRGKSQTASPRDSMWSDSATHPNRVTASDQSNDKSDVNITTVIRREIMARKGMSINAQNVKIVTINGKVTLKGPVNSASEKEIIWQMATKAAGSKNVTNELQVK